MRKEIYQHSGQLGASLFGVPIVGLVAAVVLGIIYSYLDIYIPIAGIVTFILLAGFALGLGATVSMAGKTLKCRSPKFLALMGLLTGVAGLYVSWVAFEYALLRRSDAGLDVGLIKLALNPLAVWELAKSIAETGWYTIGSSSPSGIFLWILWGIEACVVIGLPPVMAYSSLDDEVFCERCGDWIQPHDQAIQLAVPDEGEIPQALLEGELDAMERLPRAKELEPHLSVDLHQCSRCERTATYAISAVTHEVNKEGEMSEKKASLSPRFLAESATVQRIKSLADRPFPAAAEESAPTG